MNFKFSVIKKDQILTWSVIVMLIVAGFLNYRNDPNSVYDVEVTGMMDENLGDAVFVNSDNLVTNVDEIIKDISGENLRFTSDEYFSELRINRNNNYAEQMERYENILADSSMDEQQKEFAQEEIKKINSEKNAISISENLIKLKGIKEVAILINGESINVISLEKVSEAQAAQIQNIIKNELQAKIENIHITSLEKSVNGNGED